jgi:steroid delta-isomerase-like uncharacterized protein
MLGQEDKTLSVDENKAIVRRALEDVFNAANLAAVDEMYAPDFVNHTPPSLGPEVRGSATVRRFAASWRAAFPDLHFTVEDEWAEGDTVVTRWTARGTHRGTLRGIPPTGRRVVVMALEVSRVAGGKIAEEWLAWDTLGLLQQLGGVSENAKESRGREPSSHS